MKTGWDRNNQNPRITIVIAKAELAALLLSRTLDVGEIIEGYV